MDSWWTVWTNRAWTLTGWTVWTNRAWTRGGLFGLTVDSGWTVWTRGGLFGLTVRGLGLDCLD